MTNIKYYFVTNPNDGIVKIEKYAKVYLKI